MHPSLFLTPIRDQNCGIVLPFEKHFRGICEHVSYLHSSRRSYQGLNQQTPIPSPPPEPSGLIHRHKILDGIINDYFWIMEENVVSTRLNWLDQMRPNKITQMFILGSNASPVTKFLLLKAHQERVADGICADLLKGLYFFPNL